MEIESSNGQQQQNHSFFGVNHPAQFQQQQQQQPGGFFGANSFSIQQPSLNYQPKEGSFLSGSQSNSFQQSNQQNNDNDDAMSDEDCDYELGNVSFGEEEDFEVELENDIDEALEHSRSQTIDIEHYKQVRDQFN